MDEAELCNNIIILFEGRIVLRGNPVALKNIQDRVFELVPSDKNSLNDEKINSLRSMTRAVAFHGDKVRILISMENERKFLSKFSNKFSVKAVSPTIEDVFISRISG